MEASQTSDSFQHELEDFIRNQKARGLHPNVCFRKAAEDSVPQKRDSVSPGAPMLGFPFWLRNYSRSSYKRRTAENQVPYCRQRLESVKHCLKKQPVSQNRRERTKRQEEGGVVIQEPWMPKGKVYRVRGLCRQDSLSRRTVSAEPPETHKTKHRKENHHNGRDTTKGRHRSHRKERGPEDWDLWDEAILGSRY